MFKFILSNLSVLLVAVISASPCLASDIFTYQGRLSEAGDLDPIPAGQYRIGVRIWENSLPPAENPENEVPLWARKYDVPVQQGVFSLMVGAPGVPWPEANALTESLKLALSSGSRYLDITVMSDADGPEKDATEWQTLQPRQQLNAVPYAMNGVPTGTVVPFAGSNAPDGWVICDGTTTLSIADPRYSRLHDTIGNAFNDGTEPADHFRVPDLRGRTVIGSGQGDTNEAGGQPTIWELAQKTGKETHTLSVAEMPSHNHGGGNHKHGTNGPAVRTDEADYRVRFTDGGIATGGTGRVPGRSDGSYNTRSYPNTRMSGEIVQPSGGDLPHNNMQPSLVLNYIIKL